MEENVILEAQIQAPIQTPTEDEWDNLYGDIVSF
jgi:hypothetical protein